MGILRYFFIYLGQYLLNWLNLLDHALNTLLFGDADETVSARTARAREAGQAWAKYACLFLTIATRIVTFNQVKRDHCQYALDKSILPNSREIWNWSDNKLDYPPMNIIEDVEITATTTTTTTTNPDTVQTTDKLTVKTSQTTSGGVNVANSETTQSDER